jgi:hypothetical protein
LGKIWRGISDFSQADLDHLLDNAEGLNAPRADAELQSYKDLIILARSLRDCVRVMEIRLRNTLHSPETAEEYAEYKDREYFEGEGREKKVEEAGRRWCASDKEGNLFEYVDLLLGDQGLKYLHQLDLIIPIFLDMQSACHSLERWVGAKGKPAAKRVSEARSSAGGKGKAAKKDIVRAILIGVISSLPKDKGCKSFSQFLDKNHSQLCLALDAFSEYCREFEETSPGTDLKPENLQKNIKLWCQEFSNFRQAVVQALPGYDVPPLKSP